MSGSMSVQVRALVNLRTAELKDRYVELYGEEPSTNNRENLLKRVAWRTQANAEGGLTERARLRADALANDSDLRVRAPSPRPEPAPLPPEVAALGPFKQPPKFARPSPGTILTRDYKGTRIAVLVRVDGFEWDGRVYRTLSAVANAVTGNHWNGNRFFGIDRAHRVAAADSNAEVTA
jgi:hypothetical protein